MSADDRREVIRLINEWNSSRYELFALSQPNERLEFHGVMRFYFQDAGEKVSTKCVRVDSTASTDDVIKVLIEKFRPDMKSLSSAKDYAIYEVHADSQERKLGATERPLWIQLDWGKDGREGRFLLKNENAKTVQFDTTGDGLGLLRDKKRLSKREKKKQLKLNKDSVKENKVNVAEHLYKEVPDSNFTRSISNPEIVMARRRQQKLENKLKQIKNRDGGGTLKIFGETLKPDIPYKTLLMSNQDVASFAVKETLEKYGLPNEDPDNYCLVQVVTPSKEEREKHGAQTKEYILEDNACPLAILMKHPSTGGSIIFQIRRCTPDILDIRKHKKKAELEKQQQQQQQIQMQQDQQKKFQSIHSQPNLVHQHQQLQQNIQQQTLHQQMSKTNTLQPRGINNLPSKQNVQNGYQTDNIDSMQNVNMSNGMNELPNNTSKLPFLVELTHEGYELQSPRIIQIKSDFYEIGNDKFFASTHPTNYIRIDPNVPGIEKKHCALKKSNDNMQLLLVPYAETYINDRLVKESTQLFNGFTIRLGKYSLFRLENPNELAKQPVAKQIQQPQNYLFLADQQEQPLQQQKDSPKIQPRMNQLQAPQTLALSNSMGVNNAAKPSEGLPGLLEFPDDGEDSLLANICTTNQSNFKLAPVYTMYMMLRYRLSQKYKSDLTLSEKLQSSSLLIHKMVNYIREAVDVNHLNKFVLPYWLVNSSELLYFLKQDVHLSQISYDAQELLADCVRTTFNYMVNIMQQQLDCVLGSFFDPSDHIEDVNLNQVDANFESDLNLNDIRPTLNHVIQVLNQTMNLLRGVRVNAALTIQLFSQLFHYISMWLFNKLIRDQRSGLCSRYWGDKLTRRLNKIQLWSEKQGLELAADCHLQRITQAAFFLHASKYDVNNDLSKISSVCFGLNSLQIKCLLKNYLQAPNEPPLSQELCNQLLLIAVNTQDRLLSIDGKQIQLEEEADLQLPFLLPEDGHSSEVIKGLPTGLLDFLENLQNSGHCWLWQNTQGPGSWKKFMNKESAAATTPMQAPTPISTNQLNINNQVDSGLKQNIPPPNVNASPLVKPILQTQISNASQQHPTSQIPQQQQQLGPNIVKLKLNKKNNGLGLSIVAARGTNQLHTGIYVKSVVPGGASDDDGRLNAGDQLLAVDDVSLINVTQERAAELMTKSGPVVCLTIAKDAASYHDLDALLNKSPLPQPQQTMHQSMMSLNNGPANNGPQQINTQFTAATLPRNHQQFNNMIANQNGSFNPNQYQQAFETPMTHIDNSSAYKTRSISQEILKSNSEIIGTSTASIASPLKPSIRQQTVTSPTASIPQQYHHRGLPNEQQIRYGSERPMNNGINSNLHTTRALPNEMIPRFGSERPASSMGQLQHQQHPYIQQRYNNGTDLSPIKQQQLNNVRIRQSSLSELDEINYNNHQTLEQQQQQQEHPIKNQFEDLYGKVRNNSSNNQQNGHFEERSQFNINNNNNNFVNHQQQLQQQHHHQQQQQQFKTLPSRNGNINNTSLNIHSNGIHVNGINGMDEQQRTKSFGQLYEQIWTNNNQNGNSNISNQHFVQTQRQVHHQQQQPQHQNQIPHYTASVDDLNIKNLEISNGNHPNFNNQHNLHPNGSISTNGLNEIKNTNLNQHMRKYDFIDTTSNGNIPNNSNNKVSRSNIQQLSNGQRATANVPINRAPNELNNEYPPRNYENQIINNNNNVAQPQNVTKPPPPPVMAKPVIPNKPFNINVNNTIHNNLLQNGYVTASTNSLVSNSKANIRQSPHDFLNEQDEEELAPTMVNAKLVNNNSTTKLNNSHREEEQFRVSLLQQRMEMLQILESKSQRTNEEENKLNKLRTEIEFDRRVIEMNSMSNTNNYLDETNEENDMDYSPEVRERLTNQMRDDLLERRRLFEQQQLIENANNNQKEEDAYTQKLERRFAQLEKEREEQKFRQNLQILKKDNEIEQSVMKQRELKEQARLEMEEYKKRREDETSIDRIMEMKREEMRLKKHIDLNLRNSSSNLTNGNGYNDHNEIELVESTSSSNLHARPQKHVQFVSEAEIMSPKQNGLRFGSNGNSPEQSNSNGSTPPPPPPPPLPPMTLNTTPQKRVMFSDLEFERQTPNNGYGHNNGEMPHTPSVIGANEVYVDQRLKMKQKQQEQQQLASMFIEGEKLSFKDKMKLFAKQSGEMINEPDNKYKVSRKQREIESKFDSK